MQYSYTSSAIETELIPSCTHIFSRIQCRFGWTHWGEFHGRKVGEPYKIILRTNEYLVTAEYFSAEVTDQIIFVSNLGERYQFLGDVVNNQPNLGAELAYLAGYIHTSWSGIRISELAVYQTDCY